MHHSTIYIGNLSIKLITLVSLNSKQENGKGFVLIACFCFVFVGQAKDKKLVVFSGIAMNFLDY